jgi:hypothetical protein
MVPQAFNVYNKNMGGVDQVDQIRTGEYGIDNIGRPMKWTFRLFEAYFNLCLSNSYNAYRYFKRLQNVDVDPFDFNATVAEAMLGNPAYEAFRTPTSIGKRLRSTTSEHKLINGRTVQERTWALMQHSIAESEPGSRDEQSSRRARGRCVLCYANKIESFTSLYCNHCSITSMNDIKYLHPQCFAEYHRSLAIADDDMCEFLHITDIS